MANWDGLSQRSVTIAARWLPRTFANESWRGEPGPVQVLYDKRETIERLYFGRGERTAPSVVLASAIAGGVIQKPQVLPWLQPVVENVTTAPSNGQHATLRSFVKRICCPDNRCHIEVASDNVSV